MERNIDRKTLSYSKGMTNIPSDLLSGDDELVESDGFIFKDGEMKPIRKPVEIGNVPYKIMYAHKMADYENLIAYDGEESIYVYKLKDGKISEESVQQFDVGKVMDVKAVGNTLVVATEGGLYYLLYKNTRYIDLGSKIPEPKCTFNITDYKSEIQPDVLCELNSFCNHGTFHAIYNDYGELVKIKEEDIGDSNYSKYNNFSVIAERKTDFDNAIQGCIGAVLNKIKEKNRFCFPFFVRYALKLFDGTYTKISNPILCYCPTVSKNYKFVPMKNEGTGGKVDGEYSGWANYWQYMPVSAKLEITAQIDNAENWKDIISGIAVFATEEVTPYKAGSEWEFKLAMDTNYLNYANFATTGAQQYHWQKDVYNARTVLWPKEEKTDQEIMDELLEKTVFYKLCDIELGETEGVIKDHVVSTLTTQEQLKVDDYYGWTATSADKLFAYNGRLNIFGLNRYPWKGFSEFSVNQDQGFGYQMLMNCYVHIESGSMDAWVKEVALMVESFLGTWFYYPDTNATEAVFTYGKTSSTPQERGWHVLKVSLKKHKRLNGAYYLGRLAHYDNKTTATRLPAQDIENYTPEVDETAHEVLDSQIYTSVVNNPFAFEAKGDNTVGTGSIIGIEANTEAVSQGQFGQYPLIVFTTDGIYAMSVSSDGLYSSTHPMSRDVCNKLSPFVPTDKMVYFTSKKGLMATTGGASACVSERMRGKAASVFATVGNKFVDFMQGECLIAYDYEESLLLIFNKGMDYQYVYNMVDGTYGIAKSGMMAQAVVNDYPDNLIQDSEGNVHSLFRKPDVNDDKNVYDGHFVTRPLKLGGGITLKSIRDMRHLVSTDNGTMKIELFGSNDCRNWQRIGSLRGKPWKYFTIRYSISGFKATDSFAGTVVDVQARRGNKMR